MAVIRNIIFDLGGVIINLDQQKAVNSFESLGITNFSNLYSQQQQTALFDDFDKGTISEADFFKCIKELAGTALPISELVDAWNSMLLDFPAQRLKWIYEYRQSFRTFLLSNTNETHIREFESILEKSHGVKNLEPYFHRVYYSCRMGMRKPDVQIFQSLINNENLVLAETLFIDDTPLHVAGAKKAGLHAEVLQKGEEFDTLIKKVLSSFS